MNTLQKIADLEQRIAMLDKLVVQVPKIIQEVGNIKGDIDTVNKAIKNIVDAVNVRTSELAKIDNILITRQMSLEQSVSSLSKTAAALVSELSDNKLLNQESVMARLRKSDEKLDQDRVEKMLEQKVIREIDAITKDSFIVVSQKFKAKTGEVDIVSEYRSVDLSSPEIDDATKETYVGKAKGGVTELNLDDGVLETTILQVYEFVQVYAKSEGESQAVTPTDVAQPEAKQ